MTIWILLALTAASTIFAAPHPRVQKSKDQLLFEKWAKIKTPLPGPSQPIGFYSAGCLAGAAKLSLDGDGWAAMRTSRNRYYGHPDLVNYLENLSAALRAQRLPLMLIGDLGPPRGGPMLSGHASHQMGLDVDIWLNMSEKRPTKRERETWSAISYVEGRKKLRSSWGPTQAKLVATAADFERVDRIFISPPIKRYFCQNYPNAKWLYRLRAWWGHTEHLHVRLSCPSGAATCTTQAPLDPNDSGCGAELDWWWSKEADEEWEKIVNDPTPRAFPELPEACDVMVKSASARVKNAIP